MDAVPGVHTLRLELLGGFRLVVNGSATTRALTARQQQLLAYLALNAGRVLSRAQILDHVWNYSFDGDGNIVESYICYLRRKLDPLGPPMIHTQRGVGYSLRPPERARAGPGE